MVSYHGQEEDGDGWIPYGEEDPRLSHSGSIYGNRYSCQAYINTARGAECSHEEEAAISEKINVSYETLPGVMVHRQQQQQQSPPPHVIR